MSSLYLWAFIAELWGVMFIIWGVLHENKLIQIEQKFDQMVKQAAHKVIKKTR